jgi:hypothetical protein
MQYHAILAVKHRDSNVIGDITPVTFQIDWGNEILKGEKAQQANELKFA